MLNFKSQTQASNLRVTVEAPARLHIGFLDLNGDLGRKFGSLGITVNGISTRLMVERAEVLSAQGPSGERALRYLRRLLTQLGLEGGVRLVLHQSIPEHAGLGSGTQQALAVGTAVARLYGLNLSVCSIVRLLDRGLRSGIGIGAFEQGGFIVDGGRGVESELPPVIARLDFPMHWRLLLVFDEACQGIHGDQELAAFKRLTPLPAEAAAHVCRLVMMRVLPAIAEQDLKRFGQGIGEIQRIVGDYFAPIQGGRFTSPAVREALEWIQDRGVPCIGQSSWGPTGFAIVDGDTRAYSLLKDLERSFGGALPLRFQVVSARNQGHIIEMKARTEKPCPVEAEV